MIAEPLGENVESKLQKWRSPRNGRLKHEFFFTESGKPTREFRGLLEVHPQATFSEIILTLMPHYVKYCGQAHSTWQHPPDSWMRDNIKGAWTIWSLPRDAHDDKTDFYAFEFATDAIFFKLRWYQ